MKIIFIFIIPLFLISCASNQRTGEFLQTNSATTLQRDYEDIKKFLLLYKQKLDARNPNLYNKKLKYKIGFEIEHNLNSLNIANKSYKDYLKKAFDDDTKYRNDFLILGLYKYVYYVYKIKEGHKLTALSYDKEEFKKLYYTLKVLRWKIRTNKDKNGNFTFITWQNRWQIELKKALKREKLSLKLIKNLPSIKNKKENLLSHNNFNFEILLTQIIDRVAHSLTALGEEPLNLGINAMKAIIFL